MLLHGNQHRVRLSKEGFREATDKQLGLIDRQVRNVAELVQSLQFLGVHSFHQVTKGSELVWLLVEQVHNQLTEVVEHGADE